MTMHAPEIEAAPWEEQAALDDTAYRAQISYLFENSAFYRQKLTEAGFPDAESVGGLSDIARLPMTEKDELRATRDEAHPIGTHLAAPMAEVVRIYSTSGTTGTPSYIPLTASDLESWVEISQRSYGASGVRPGERMVTTYNAGPFVAGAVGETLPSPTVRRDRVVDDRSRPFHHSPDSTGGGARALVPGRQLSR